MAPSGISLEKESLVSVRASMSRMSYPCQNCPCSNVLHSFLRQETMKMPSMRRGQVRTEKGKLKGSTYQIPTQITVDTTKMMLPLTVQTPPHLELLFSSWTRRQERVTPGMMTSMTGSQEHFLKRLLTRSGTSKKKGEESSPAQSLQEMGRRKWRMMQTTLTVPTIIAIDQQLSFSELKWKIFMLPTQMQPARMLQRIQLSQKQATMTSTNATTPLRASHCRTILQSGFLSLLMRQKVQLRQRKTKLRENAMPTYLMTVKDFHRSRQVEKQSDRIRPTPTALNTRKFFHFRTYRSGRCLIRMDQTWECIATPTIIQALMSAMKRQPTQNCLCLLDGSQFIRKLKRTPEGSLTVALLKQLQAEQAPPDHPQLQLNLMSKWVRLDYSMKGCGSLLGDTDISISVLRRGGMPSQATVKISPFDTSMMLRLPLRQLRTSLNVASSQPGLRSPLVKMRASSLASRMYQLATRRVCGEAVMSRQEMRMRMGVIQCQQSRMDAPIIIIDDKGYSC